MLVRDLLDIGTTRLSKAGIDCSTIDTELLLGHCLSKSRTQLYLANDEVVSAELTDLYRTFLGRREKREPVAYILGQTEFWSMDFMVNNHVLIPRPETEFMLEKVLAICSEDNITNALDLCCGSGVIACVLSKELCCTVTAIDISPEALKVTLKNVVKHGLKDKVEILKSDLFSKIPTTRKFPLIVSNPPYVSPQEIDSELEPEVAEYEPKLALDGGGNYGLKLIEKISENIGLHIDKPGRFFMEIGAEQGEAVTQIFSSLQLFDDIKIFKDYAGRDRVLYAGR